MRVGDDAVRPAFPAVPSGLGPDGRPVQQLHPNLVGIRRRNPWLVRARAQVHTLGNAAPAYTLADPDPDPGTAVAVALRCRSRRPLDAHRGRRRRFRAFPPCGRPVASAPEIPSSARADQLS
ncbi:hypothetical protein [Streptomyces sp. SD15]